MQGQVERVLALPQRRRGAEVVQAVLAGGVFRGHKRLASVLVSFSVILSASAPLRELSSLSFQPYGLL